MGKFLGGRGNLGILNTLRRQIIYLINWEINFNNKNEKLILQLLELLIQSVTSDHYRSITAFEILQCLDYVMKILICNKTRNNWILLLNNIGKHNLIIREYIMNSIISIFNFNEQYLALQDLESKGIRWKMINNPIYLILNLLLKEGNINIEEVKNCMKYCLDSNIILPQIILELYLISLPIKNLLQHPNFQMTKTFFYIIIDKATNKIIDSKYDNEYLDFLFENEFNLILKKLSELCGDPCKMKIIYKLIELLNKIYLNNNNCYKNYKLSLLICFIINLTFKMIEITPWDISLWICMKYLLSQILIYFISSDIMDIKFNLNNITKDLYYKYNLINKFQLTSEDIGHFKYLLNSNLINNKLYFRYYYFDKFNNIITDIQKIKFNVYSMICMLYYLTYNNKDSSFNKYFTYKQHINIFKDIVPNFKLNLSTIYFSSLVCNISWIFDEYPKDDFIRDYTDEIFQFKPDLFNDYHIFKRLWLKYMETKI
ncbi:hypothetical protein ACR3K2_28730 [Cryptosporidium serpentis]